MTAWYEDGKRWEDFEGFQIAIDPESGWCDIWRGRDLLVEEVRNSQEAEDLIRFAVECPASDEARLFGCKCQFEPVRSTMIDPPEPIVKRDCPLHGDQRDPDYLNDIRKEKAA